LKSLEIAEFVGLVGYPDGASEHHPKCQDRDPSIQQLGFPLKSGQLLGFAGELLRQHLDGRFTIEDGVLSPIHLAHAALADLLDDFVMAASCPDHGSS